MSEEIPGLDQRVHDPVDPRQLKSNIFITDVHELVPLDFAQRHSSQWSKILGLSLSYLD